MFHILGSISVRARSSPCPYCFFPSVIGCFLAVHLPARSPLMLLLLSPGRQSPMEPAASGFEVRRRIETLDRATKSVRSASTPSRQDKCSGTKVGTRVSHAPLAAVTAALCLSPSTGDVWLPDPAPAAAANSWVNGFSKPLPSSVPACRRKDTCFTENLEASDHHIT